MGAGSWAAAKIQLTAKIGDTQFPNCVAFTSTHELNTIPSAILVVAVGRNVVTNDAAEIHQAVDVLKIRLPASVYLTATPLGNQDEPNDWGPAEDGVRIFNGWAVGTGWRRTGTDAAFTIHLEHWLADLDYGSAISAASDPGNPINLSYSANFIPPNPSAGGSGQETPGPAGQPLWTPFQYKTISDQDGLQAAIQQGLWGNVLQPLLLEIANNEPIDRRLLPPEGDGTAQINQDTINALKRMSSAAGGDFPASTQLDLSQDENQSDIVDGIQSSLQLSQLQKWAHTTMWGKIVGEWGNEFFLAVSPRVEDAVVFPFTGGLSVPPLANLYLDDYDAAQISGKLHRVIRAVGIYGSCLSSAGGNANIDAINPAGADTSDSSYQDLVGFYQSDPPRYGMVLVKEAPNWLTRPLAEYRFTQDTTAVQQGKVLVTAFDPAPPQNNTGTPPIPTAVKAYRPFLDRFAQQWYVLESLKGRVGEVHGRLRFDIAPGTAVMVEGGTETFIQDDKLGASIFATVIRVTHSLNAETREAGTSFTVAWHRTELENENDDTSIEKPPLYTKGWAGAPLIDGFTPQ